MRQRSTSIAAFVVCLGVAGVAASQTAPPTLQTVVPTGAQRGTSVSITIQGTNIADPARVIFSEPGLSA